MDIGFETRGHGPAKVLVLHGWFGDHAVWSPTFPFLDEKAFTYVFPDYRGYGASRGLKGGYTIAEIAGDALGVADRLGWERFSVVGHSMGGMAAQRLAIDAAGRVLAMVGVTPVPATGVPLPPELEAVFGSVVSSDDAGRGVLQASLGGRYTPALVDFILRHARATSTPEAFAAYFTAFSKTNFSGEAAGLKAPALILIGEHDQGVSEEFVRATFPAMYPHAVLEILPGAGHYPMLETPPRLVGRIEGFLKQYGA
jgi:pimeloyl-ACP methyl ester carboxylesterase